MMVSRRSFLRALPVLLCAPAIVRASSIMPVKAMRANNEIVAYVYDDPNIQYMIYATCFDATKHPFSPNSHTYGYSGWIDNEWPLRTA